MPGLGGILNFAAGAKVGRAQKPIFRLQDAVRRLEPPDRKRPSGMLSLPRAQRQEVTMSRISRRTMLVGSTLLVRQLPD
jgi:hypothetical protein